MIKSKKLAAAFLIPFLYVWHCAAKNFTTEQAAQARKDITTQAKQYIGCPYQSGAIGPEAFDCSGLIFTVFREAAGVQMPRSVKAIYSKSKIINAQDAEAGDLIFFKTSGDGSITHIGIYIGKNQFIHAASDGNNTGVIVSSLKERYYSNAFAAVGRVIPSGRPKKEADDIADDEIVSEEDIPDSNSGEGGDSLAYLEQSAGSDKKNGNGKWYSKIIFDATVFCDWNVFDTARFMLNWRGISLETNARYSGWKFEPGVGTIFRYNHGTGNFQLPIVASLTFNDYVKVYAGPVINFGNPSLPGRDETARGSVFPGIFGLSFQTPKLKAGKVALSLVQDVSYTVYNDTDGGALAFYKSAGSGIVLSTGVRVTLPFANLL